MVIGLVFGALGLAGLGLAPDGGTFIAAVVVSSIWGLAQPTILALMTARVSESEQGQLQGASMSVASLAGIIAPLFFGWIYGLSIGDSAPIPHLGAAFLIAGVVLALSALIGLRAGRRGPGGDPRRGSAAPQGVESAAGE
jgi:MFS transporter, DHA1 family, tetracycline resistance protein